MRFFFGHIVYPRALAMPGSCAGSDDPVAGCGRVVKPVPDKREKGCGWILGMLCILGLITAGCEDRGVQSMRVSLVRVNDQSISVGEFKRRFDAVSAEAPMPGAVDPVVEKEMKLRLLHQLTEELILIERARELNLVVSDQELERAIKAIRADYPEGEFENVLVEQAILYGEWQEQLRMRLLKEKVVQEDLESSITLTPEEVSASYEANFPDRGATEDRKLNDASVDENVIKLVRRQKAQAVYQAWLLDIKARYDVEINAIAWEDLIGS